MYILRWLALTRATFEKYDSSWADDFGRPTEYNRRTWKIRPPKIRRVARKIDYRGNCTPGRRFHLSERRAIHPVSPVLRSRVRNTAYYEPAVLPTILFAVVDRVPLVDNNSTRREIQRFARRG